MPVDIAVTSRLRYVRDGLGRFTPKRVLQLARQISTEQGKWMPAVAADMLWWAAFHDTAFIDYYEADFALLNRSERKTFMTSLLQHHIAKAVNDPEQAETFASKLRFNRAFADHLGREWCDLGETDAAGLRAFAQRHPVIIAKVPISREGHGVFRYDTADITDWDAFYRDLVAHGQVLIEQPLVQHPYLASYCAGTVNTTRITTYFDGTTVHPLVRVQKFGRGAVSDQFTWGGFFTMLDSAGHAVGPGHTGKHLSAYRTHPDSDASIVDFQLPHWEQVLALLDVAARVVPGVPYIGWDVVVGPERPVLLEGNWIPGLYESRVSATGIRRGTRPDHERVMSW